MITNSDYYLEQIPRYVRGEMTEPCRSGIRTIHVDPAGHVKRCPDFPTDFHWRDFKTYEPIDCNACYYACRGEAQAPLRLSRVRDVMAPRTPRRVSDELLFVNASQVVTCAGPGARAARRRDARRRRSRRTSRCACRGERDRRRRRRGASCATRYPDADGVDCGGGVLTPGLVDSHTHAVFGRAALRGAGAARGRRRLHGDRAARRRHPRVRARPPRAQRGRAVRARACRGSRALAAYGTTTVEVKSGYGLSLEDELKTLRVIAAARRRRCRCASCRPGSARTRSRSSTASDADGRARVHRPARRRDAARGRARAARAVRRRLLRARRLHRRREPREILAAARAAGLGIKLHADELQPGGGAELAAELGATSADHLAAISRRRDRGARGAPGPSRRCCPARCSFSASATQAPARRLIEAGAAVALATDFNPGTSPTVNFPLILTLGVSQLRLSVAEALVAATVNGAAALGLADESARSRPGFSADLALFDDRGRSRAAVLVRRPSLSRRRGARQTLSPL